MQCTVGHECAMESNVVFFQDLCPVAPLCIFRTPFPCWWKAKVERHSTYGLCKFPVSVFEALAIPRLHGIYISIASLNYILLSSHSSATVVISVSFLGSEALCLMWISLILSLPLGDVHAG